MMFIKIYKLAALIIFFSIQPGLQAQEAMTAAGGNITGNGGSASYSIGQVAYIHISDVDGIIEEGVQQPYEIWVYAGIDEPGIILSEISVFPNPVTNILTLKIANQNLDELSYQLYEMNGKIIENEKVETNETYISMKNLSAGTYLLKVFYNNHEAKTFKIMKHE